MTYTVLLRVDADTPDDLHTLLLHVIAWANGAVVVEQIQAQP